ncbi:DUF4387 family protein [Halobellus sp. GM3]|uniref:DUF4387 family protein n=1 Tax=Halobellus sp. GM3 TaxID=3458410 RepID=UPI00403DFA88
MTTLAEVASIVRSKNAGPFTITLDVFFETDEAYRDVVDRDVLTPAVIADVYGLEADVPVSVYAVDEVSAIKISLPRSIPAGDRRDTDVYGMQQYTPLLAIRL